ALVGALELLAAEADELAADGTEVGRDELAPRAIADALDRVRGGGELEGQDRRDPPGRAGPRRDLVVTRPVGRPDAIREVASREQVERLADIRRGALRHDELAGLGLGDQAARGHDRIAVRAVGPAGDAGVLDPGGADSGGTDVDRGARVQ